VQWHRKECFECLLRPFWHVFAIKRADPGQALKAYRRSRGIAPPLLHLGSRWRWMVTTTPQPLFPRDPLNMKLRGPKNGLDILENRTVSYPVDIPTPIPSPVGYAGSYFIRYVRNMQQRTSLGGFWIASLRKGHGLSFKITVSRDVTPCGLVVIYRRFGETCFSYTSSVKKEVNLQQIFRIYIPEN